MEKKYCKNCVIALPEDWNDKLCKECQEKRRNLVKKILCGIGIASVAVVAFLFLRNRGADNLYALENDYTCDDDDIGDASIHDSATVEYKPLIPLEIFRWLLRNWGEDAAFEIYDKVERGEMTTELVETLFYRPDIEPKDWQDFEDGWRPEGW